MVGLFLLDFECGAGTPARVTVCGATCPAGCQHLADKSVRPTNMVGLFLLDIECGAGTPARVTVCGATCPAGCQYLADKSVRPTLVLPALRAVSIWRTGVSDPHAKPHQIGSIHNQRYSSGMRTSPFLTGFCRMYSIFCCKLSSERKR